jgi:tRNA(Ile2)-agmatinylcytidine synthase
MKFWIGIDDTDSPKGMCTTYLATLIIERLEKENVKLIGFPRLIRLNPTIPFKTRGNGAVSFLVEFDESKRDDVIDTVREIVEEYAELEDDRTNPGVVFIDAERDDVLNYLSRFALRVVRDVVTLDEALFIIGKFLLPHLKFKKGRGLIGALASVGLELSDYTIEVLAYRKPERFGTEREIDEESFFEADWETYPGTWDTVDWCNETVVAVPGSPDPVLFGIRGDDFHAVMKAFEMVKTETIDRYMVFITNQGTDMHLIPENEVKALENNRSYILRGKVVEEPYDIVGGHVFFTIETKFGDVKCAAFEPTKQFRNIVRRLRKGDIVEVYGSMKKDTINLEKINVIELAEIYVEENPICPKCGKRMDSAGRGKGFRCKRCKTRAFEKVKRKIERDLDTGFYEVPPCARRHLSKPLIRMPEVKRHIFR